MRFTSVLSFIFVCLTGSQVFAWGSDGHSIVGYIAEKNLTPAAQSMLQDIIGLEPMALTAIWADLVRDDARFKKYAAYHFYEIPSNFTAGNFPANMAAEKDAHTVILQTPDKILNKTTTRPEKIIWLRYLVHVVGDVHQPLHVGNGLDRGGNLCLVRWQRSGSTREEEANLHSFWDTKILNILTDDYKKKNPDLAASKPYFGYVETADLILKELGTTITMSTANKVSQNDWYDETRGFHPKVYPGAAKSPAERPYCRVVDTETNKVTNGKFSTTSIPLITQDYLEIALPIVKKQLILASYRLAGLLNAMGEKYVVSPSRKMKKFNVSDSMLVNKEFRAPQSTSDLRKKIQPEYPDCHHDHN